MRTSSRQEAKPMMRLASPWPVTTACARYRSSAAAAMVTVHHINAAKIDVLIMIASATKAQRVLPVLCHLPRDHNDLLINVVNERAVRRPVGSCGATCPHQKARRLAGLFRSVLLMAGTAAASRCAATNAGCGVDVRCAAADMRHRGGCVRRAHLGACVHRRATHMTNIGTTDIRLRDMRRHGMSRRWRGGEARGLMRARDRLLHGSAGAVHMHQASLLLRGLCTTHMGQARLTRDSRRNARARPPF